MNNFKLIVASQSPRRQALVSTLGIPFEVRLADVEEVYPSDIDLYSVPEYLARLKATPHRKSLKPNEILLTSDTVVIFQQRILGKPKDRQHAIEMLGELSGKMHEVVTGIALETREKSVQFSTLTRVYFSPLTQEEIAYYVDNYAPYDKAGAYGIQEWIGYIGVEKIEGCYYNVMGLPVHDLYKALIRDFSTKTV